MLHGPTWVLIVKVGKNVRGPNDRLYLIIYSLFNNKRFDYNWPFKLLIIKYRMHAYWACILSNCHLDR